MLGALLEAAAALQGMGDEDPAHLRARWRRRGLRAFDADRKAGQEGEDAEGRRTLLPSPGGPP